ncbi:MAG TPA: hypothetical protein VHD85_15215 [Terracidiphilus sp.]|nr:hypothetical protein [Terracidiphilus sp.]
MSRLRRCNQLVVEVVLEDAAGVEAGAGVLSVLAGALVSDDDADESDEDELLFEE